MESMDRFCWSCGSGISKGDQFCRKCGSYLGQGQPIEQGHETQPEASTVPEIDPPKAKPTHVAGFSVLRPPMSLEEILDEANTANTPPDLAMIALHIIGALGWLLAGLSFITTTLISLPNAISTGGEYWSTIAVFAGLLIIGAGVTAGIFCRMTLRGREGHKFFPITGKTRTILIGAAILIPFALIFLQGYRSSIYIPEENRAEVVELRKEIKHEESKPQWNDWRVRKGTNISPAWEARYRVEPLRSTMEKLKGDMPRSEVFAPFIVFGVVYTVGLIIFYRNRRMRQDRGDG